MKKLIFVLCLLQITAVSAQPLQYEGTYNPDTPLQQYFAAEDNDYKRSIIYVFFNNDSCYGCPQTIAELEDIYNRYYQNRYSFFIINYQQDAQYDFATAYNLKEPLSVVLVKVDDGAAMGYEKLTDLQNQISDVGSLERYFRYRVDSFLGN